MLVERVPIEFAAITYITKEVPKSTPKSKRKTSFQGKKNVVSIRPTKTETQKILPVQTTSNINKEEESRSETSLPVQKGLIMPFFTKDEILEAFKKARFFIIRSSNLDNIHISQTYSEWATTRSNEGRLNEAFNSTPHVFLIFAVSKIYEFKGFARMSSQITNKMNIFWKNIQTIKLGGCFKINWITNSPLSFHRIGNMTNPYNDNELIKKSRDCTELEPGVGAELCRMFDVPYRDPNIPPEPWIVKANQNLVVKSPPLIPAQVTPQIPAQPTPLVEAPPKPMPKIDKEIKVNNSKMDFSKFVEQLIKTNPKFPEILPKMDNRIYESFMRELSGVVDDFEDKYFLRKKEKRKNSREEDRRKKIKKDKKSKKHKKRSRKDKRSSISDESYD